MFSIRNNSGEQQGKNITRTELGQALVQEDWAKERGNHTREQAGEHLLAAGLGVVGWARERSWSSGEAGLVFVGESLTRRNTRSQPRAMHWARISQI